VGTAPPAAGAVALLQTAQKNQRRSANGSADVPPAPSRQNPTAAADTAASPNGSDVSTPTAAAPGLITTPTQAGKGAAVGAYSQ